MYAKIYWLIWTVLLAVAALFFVAGMMTPLVAVVFGFIAFGMVFMGMMSVLPSTVGHNAPDYKMHVSKASAFAPVAAKTSAAVNTIGAGLSAPAGMRKANLH
ncbi:MAG: hypothetical protein IPM25_08805 [Chloracidobacterium sp.]|nr:hypothetical protein [Chloracidobacterium sp.]